MMSSYPAFVHYESGVAAVKAGWQPMHSWRGGSYCRVLRRILADVPMQKNEASAREALNEVRRAWAKLRQTIELPDLPALAICLSNTPPGTLVLVWRPS